jgi:ComF family protein
MGYWTRALSSLLDVLAPPSCVACDLPSQDGPFCLDCGRPAGAGDEPEVGGRPLLVLGSYAPPLSTAILRFKYEGRPELSVPLARLLAPRLDDPRLPRDAPLVPVPLHARRLATRGYNQAALLAQELARLTQRACRPRLLQRVRETERQVGKSRRERRENPDGAFELRTPGPARVVLVDDVVTTGSTVRACATALADGGIELSAVIALAHAEQR